VISGGGGEVSLLCTRKVHGSDPEDRVGRGLRLTLEQKRSVPDYLISSGEGERLEMKFRREKRDGNWRPIRVPLRGKTEV